MRRATKIDPQNFGTSKAIDPELFTKYNVKRGLRNMDGTGVVAGITQITDVHGYSLQDGTFIPEEGTSLFALVGQTASKRRPAYFPKAY